MKRLLVAILIALVLIAAVSAFAAQQRSKTPQWWPGERPTPKPAGVLGGQIAAMTDTTFSLQTPSAGTPIFNIGPATQVKGQKTSLGDLAVGDKVVVNYTTRADGNVWARVIEVPGEANMAFGSVASVSESAITITTENGDQRTFVVGSKTVVLIKGVESTIDQVQTGDPAIVHFAAGSEGPIAKRVRVLAQGVWPNLAGKVVGKVLSIDTSSVTLRTEKNGDQTFGIYDKTKFSVYGQPARLDQIVVGANVRVAYKVLDNGDRMAALVAMPMPVYKGEITSIGPDGFGLAVDGQSITVSVTADTKITTHTYVGSLADLKVGEKIVVRGMPQNGVVQALRVEFRAPAIKGTVVSISGNNIVVKTVKQRAVNVTASSTTVVFVRPRTAPNHPGSDADVKPGLPVNIGGRMTGPNAMNAFWIDVMVP